MSREIKFRAWEKISGAFEMYYGETGNGFSIQDILSGNFSGLCDKMLEPKKDNIFMMWTGLHDKYGKEIYEGDIVKCWDSAAEDKSWGLDKVHTGVIEFTPDCFSLKIPGKLTNDTPCLKSRENDVYLPDWSNAENIERVGNIYENPELLNQ